MSAFYIRFRNFWKSAAFEDTYTRVSVTLLQSSIGFERSFSREGRANICRLVNLLWILLFESSWRRGTYDYNYNLGLWFTLVRSARMETCFRCVLD